jgi:hypothetical protein
VEPRKEKEEEEEVIIKIKSKRQMKTSFFKRSQGVGEQ